MLKFIEWFAYCFVLIVVLVFSSKRMSETEMVITVLATLISFVYMKLLDIEEILRKNKKSS